MCTNSVLKVWFVELPKAFGSCLLGFLLGIWPVIPFTITIFAITLVRLPINIYKTFKVAANTVILRINLRILIILILPVGHLLFPIIALIVGCCGAFGYFIGATIACIYRGESWFTHIKQFPDLIKQYWNAHVQFVEETINHYDHPSGVPLNWDDTMYVIPVGPVQIFLGLILTLYGLVVCGLGIFFIITIKILPILFYQIYQYSRAYFNLGWVIVVPTCPFYLYCFCFVVILSPVVYILILLLGFFAGLRCPYVFIQQDNLQHGVIESINILKTVDEYTEYVTPCQMALLSFYDRIEFHNVNVIEIGIVAETSESSDLFWDILTDRCVMKCAELLKKRWILKEDVECLDPAIIINVPAITMLAIVADSVRNEGEDIDAIILTENMVWTSTNRPKQDNNINMIWPRLVDIKNSLNENPELVGEENIDIITSQVCSNQNVLTDELKEYLDGIDKDKNNAVDKIIWSKIMDLSLMVSRVKPMQDRLHKMVNYQYEDAADEELEKLG